MQTIPYWHEGLDGDLLTRRWGQRFGRLCVLAAILFGTAYAGSQELGTKLAGTFARLLESRIPRVEAVANSRLDGIIVLGGHPSRVKAALRLASLYPDAIVVLSGPGEDEVAVARADSDVAGRLAVDRRAKNTYENAVYSKEVVRPRAGQCWVVVTSALHMPRAIGVFDAVGFPVVPWTVPITPRGPSELGANVWHEMVGLFSYRALGRTRELLPTGRPSKVGCMT